MMIDNITGHIVTREIIQSNIIENPLFDPSANIQYLDGIIRTRYANIDNLTIRDTRTFTELKGSLHTYCNIINGQGNQNWNEFSFNRILDSIGLIENNLGCYAKDIRLTNYEFGLNLKLEFDPTLFLTNTVIFYKYLAPCEDHKNNKSMKMLKFIYEEFIQKMYDKSKQYSLHTNILRLEMVYRTKDLFNEFGIITLDDLRRKDCYVKMFDDYMNRFDRDFLIVDHFNGTISTTDDERMQISQYTNPAFWINLKAQKVSYSKIYDYRDELNQLIQKYRLDSKKNYLRELLIENFHILLNS